MNKSLQNIISDIAVESGVNDTELVGKVYHGTIRYIVKELAAGRDITLFNFGKFTLRAHKGKRIFNVGYRKVTQSKDTVNIKFKAGVNLKKYINEKNKERLEIIMERNK